MQLTEEQRALVDLAENFVRDFVGKRGGFSMFAIGRQPDGKDQIMQSSGEFKKLSEELSAMFQVLLPLARDGVIDSSVICSPFQDGKTLFAILDVEARNQGRSIVMIRYQKKLFGGWSFGERQFKQDGPRAFAS